MTYHATSNPWSLLLHSIKRTHEGAVEAGQDSVLLFNHGSATKIIYNGKPHNLKKHAALFFVNPKVNSIQLSSLEQNQLLVVHFSILTKHKHTLFSDESVILLFQEKLYPLFKQLEATKGKTINEEYSCKMAILFQIISLFLGNEHCIEIKQPGIQHVIHRLHQQFHHTMKIEELAKDAGMSVSTFYKAFRAETGYAPLQYITYLRIEKAKELLSCTDDQVRQIANKVGYNDERYFSRLFKKWTGQSPYMYRNVHLADVLTDANPLYHSLQLLNVPQTQLEKSKKKKGRMEIQSKHRDFSMHYELPMKKDWREQFKKVADIVGEKNTAYSLIKTYDDRVKKVKYALQAVLKEETVAILRLFHHGYRLFGYQRKKCSDCLYRELGVAVPPSLLNHHFIDFDYGETCDFRDIDHLLIKADGNNPSHLEKWLHEVGCPSFAAIRNGKYYFLSKTVTFDYSFQTHLELLDDMERIFLPEYVYQTQ
ncbi:AraC family transcriptional regulator [Bacillus chungangensis]|uniref:AraC-like DNA-binding protein n=1 Tax=Bacillus chungangensis TaxID=587633 RepID=A0ABT9WYR3_9BACI|nr:AraC family transcriptional regulator [Bacillus chungangensis]MDQ0178379.1 AraC-like DNA-binding protein [Bacillus chungangensis]